MSSLKMLERECLEELFGMGGGYVMDFSNRTFSEFFRESARVNIYAEKYAKNGDSKARRLRAFIELEPDLVVGKTIADLLEYWRYKTLQPTAKETALAERANQLIQKLGCPLPESRLTARGRISLRKHTGGIASRCGERKSSGVQSGAQ